MKTVKNLRKYGKSPYNVVVLHGGPGASGEMAPVAKELSKMHGILEPLPKKLTIDGQLEELKNILQIEASLPITLIGYSWGAWLAFIFTSQNPSFVKKLILLSSGPFEESYVSSLANTRSRRLTEEDKLKRNDLLKIINSSASMDKSKIFLDLVKYFKKTDSYNPLKDTNEEIEFNYDVYESIWKEASELRKSGKLLDFGKKIHCPVVAIHGDYDPHPVEGVEKPLSVTLKKFHLILLRNCGHTPWIEKEAKEEFYKVLKRELY
ncbi:alpha/beta hydrolase [Candidatus Babeliales bacterium]|nr:alpha/beta hydrolase [Candidatus Babeliales bacterium]